MKKRFLAMTMAAVLGLSLVGCGSSSTGAKAESKADSGQTAAEGSGEAADSEGKSPIKELLFTLVIWETNPTMIPVMQVHSRQPRILAWR